MDKWLDNSITIICLVPFVPMKIIGMHAATCDCILLVFKELAFLAEKGVKVSQCPSVPLS